MHSSRFPKHALVSLLVLAAPAVTLAQGGGGPVPNSPDSFRFFLSDGSKITGKLSLAQIELETDFGLLEIPARQLVQVVPGLDHRPEEKAQIDQLVERLGKASSGGDAKLAAQAREELIQLGPSVRELLKQQGQQIDEKQRAELDKVLDRLDEVAQEELRDELPVSLQDTVETAKFTAVGRVLSQQFKIETRWGDLTVTLGDVERVERYDPDHLPDVRKSLAIDGAYLAQLKYKGTGIGVRPGDKIVVRASGSISRGGSKTYTSTPDGSSRFGVFAQNPTIYGGALVVRIGSSGQAIKVGSKSSFVAKKAGELHFAIGMRPEYVGRYSFPGKYDLTVRVLRGGE